VIQVEDTQRTLREGGRESVRLLHAVAVGNDTRAIGSDIAAGDLLVHAGERFGAAEIGLAATTGVQQVMVHGTPRVGILSTGNELLAAHEPMRPGAIRDTNGSMLAAAVRALGAEAVEMGIAHDRLDVLRGKMLDAAGECDVLLTTGGVSMGELDLMKALAAELGTVHFGRLLMKPGKPCTFATLPRPNGSGDGRPMLYFGLPGNPVSALVTFYLLALPAIRALMGVTAPTLPVVQAHTTQPLRLDSMRPEYHRVTLTWDRSLHAGAGGWRAESTGNQASSRLASFQRANALLVLPVGEGTLPAGSVVDALLLGETL
jgi:gephyrin